MADAPASQAAENHLTPSTLDFPVVGIGASAGGVPALQAFFSRVRPDPGMAYVVVVHLSPKHASNLPALLRQATSLTVVVAEQPVSITANHVYVIPPGKLLAMNDSYLRVTDLPPQHGRHVTIDLFFRTLAVVHRERALAVVLSGAGSDGAVGLTRIKEEGGVALAQQPAEAEFDGMPRAAIATGAVDWVLPAAALADKVAEIWANARRMELPRSEGDGLRVDPPPTPEAAKAAEEALRDVLILLRARTGHDFRNYKRATLLRRLERRLQVHGLPNLPAYRAFLHAQPDEAPALLKDLLIGVTNFFRDIEAFDTLQREVVPQLFERASGTPGGLRAWVAGCASGEEAYSIAMLLCEHSGSVLNPPKIHVFATDIDESAIALARMGTFPAAIETDVSQTRLRRFFDKDGESYRVRKEVREKVMFAAHNVLRDPPFSKLDLICCRNLLIYLDREVHGEILEMFHFALKPGGYLFLGSSESADTAAQLFTVVDKKQRIFRANAVPRSTRYVPTLPISTMPSVLPAGNEPRNDKRKLTYAELHRRVVEQHAPPSVLIDADANIVHLSDQAGRFLRLTGGAPSHHLLSLVQPELRLELRTAVFQAVRSGKSVESRSVRMEREGGSAFVNMIARPVQEPDVEGQFILVLFDEVQDSMANDDRAPSPEGTDPLVAELEEELRRAKEQLQSTMEHSETSTEELKASNEELQAINEELRSTTEELETSKEELQSINEELITVNHELKTKVEETSKINDDLQNLISSTDIATVFVDRAISIKRFTPYATKLFNLIPTDVGRSLLDITHRLDYAQLADDATEAFQSLRVIEREVASQDGKWYLARVLPYRTTEDRIDGAVLTFVDVTGRRRAEERMRLVTESTRDFAILSFDPDGSITTWNQGAERIFGYGEAEALGMPVEVLFTPEDRAAGVPRHEREEAARVGRAEDDRWHLRKDGHRFYCSGITTPLYENGRLSGFGKIARDLTGSKRAETARQQELQQETTRRAEAQAASEMKDEFLAMMSHELKNPLNVILMSAELLARTPQAQGDGALARAAETIRRAVIGQAQIIDDLQDVARVSTGKLRLARSAFDWGASLGEAMASLQPEAEARPLQLALTLPESPLLVDADPVRAEQIAWNLLRNAVKFTPAGGRVEVSLVADGDFACLQVVDNGQGIAADFLPRVFDMYRQAEPGGRRQAGLGIGLAVVRHLAELHGGRAEAESAGVGQGATFRVWLPLWRGDRPQGASGIDRSAVVRGRRVLVADADAESLESLRQLLTLEGAEVVAVGSGEAALDAARQAAGNAAFHAVLADVALPEPDGFQLLQALRGDSRTATLPVLALSVLSRPADVERAREAGFAGLVGKPLVLDELFGRLHDALQPR